VQGLGVWAVASIRVVVPMFAAHQDTRTPVVASAVNLVTFLSVSALLLGPLSHVAIAVANSVAAAVQLGVLLVRLRRRIGPLGLRPVATSAARIAAASLALALVGRGLASQFAWAESTSELLRIAALAITGGVSLMTFVVVAVLLRTPELGELGRAVRRRRSRAT